MSGLRFSSFNEALGEPEQDANSALTELDIGLRSGRVGEQCEAIVRFPRLFEKYPFPILINSSFLKLADVFRVGNNFLRLWVLRVCQQSEKHLDKILNVDEFVRRIFSVIHANDPVARSLTLQTLGSIAGVIPERQQVHHSIRRSLDSHDSVEVEAAIYAAMQFAAQSKTFALGMCDKISDMIRGIATPAHMKLLLIPILQHMHHDTSTATMVRKVCTDLLAKYPAKDFVVTTLNTLTKLAAATLVDIPSQVELLLNYLIEDKRWSVKKASLLGLHQMAKVGPHLWPAHCVVEAIRVARTSTHQGVVSYTLDIFIVLTQSSIICKEYVESDSELMQLCQETCNSSNSMVSAKSVKIITHMVNYCFEEGLPVSDVEEHISTVESLLLLQISCKDNNEIGDYVLKIVLQCAITLCRTHRPLANRYVDLIATQITNVSGKHLRILCEALGGIAGLEPHALKFQDLTELPEEEAPTAVMLATLIFQTVPPSKWNALHQATIDIILKRTDYWGHYKIGRAAARYGNFQVSSTIWDELTCKVSSEHSHFWLMALVHISKAENALSSSSSLLDRLGESLTSYHKCIAALRAGSSPSNTLGFQCEYASLRCELLQCFHQLVSGCHSLCFAPPPAIAVTTVTNTRDELQRCGHVTNQLRKCAKEFRQCGDMYWKLYQNAFDADPATLTNIQIMQHVCMVMAHSIDTCAQWKYQGDEPALNLSSQDISLESQLMFEASKTAGSLTDHLDKSIKNIVSHQHIDCLMSQVDILVRSPLCLPRYFFQTLQSTSVKLAVTPQPRVNGEWITVTSGSQLAVKVEGVIQHGAKPGLFRSVEKVIVTLNTQPTAKPNALDKIPETTLNLTQTVIPHRDFFSAQFLVSLGPGSVQATVTVGALVVDQTGVVWQTGQKSTLTLKQHEDPISRTH
ncbi:unnamed protein product [Nesidiocoris tenuis]|uniref:Integrator complex subunit 7 n=1 Tax=Nesidiocoris tenuis TaxID=355587 RepID=A0A6H5FTZ4_9HEMI|nr:unnamed protein product [Nesidiocoris tenuis]